MKTLQPKKTSPDLADAAHRAQLRLKAAEEKLEVAKEQARVTRQQRKAAKQAARQAKKQARLAKERVIRAEAVLARFEARLALAPQVPAKAKLRKAAVKKIVVVTRRKVSTPEKTVQPRNILKAKKATVRRAKLKPTVRPISYVHNISSPGAPELEMPVEMLPLSEQKPTPQIVKGVEEIFTDEITAAKIPMPATETAALPESPATQSTPNAQETL